MVKIVVAALDGELTVKRLSTRHGRVQLLPANRRLPRSTSTKAAVDDLGRGPQCDSLAVIPQMCLNLSPG